MNVIFSHDILLHLKSRFSMAGPGSGDEESVNDLIASIVLQYASIDTISHGRQRRLDDDYRQMESQFIDRGREKLPVDPEKLLEMARASYRIRDDDNIHIGRIAQELEHAKLHARKRIKSQGLTGGVNTTSCISTGDFLIVDGYRGICTVQKREHT